MRLVKNMKKTQNKWMTIPAKEIVENTIKSLNENGIETYFFEDEEDAKKKVYEILPKNAEIMNMTSMTLETLGISKEIVESGKYDSVRKKLMAMDAEKDKKRMNELGAAPEWSISSVSAVTQDGKLMIASNTGSQLSAAAYGAMNVVFVVGTQKIVKDIDGGFKRIYEHCLVLESERAKKAYGVEKSYVNKILIINKEFNPKRIKLIFVNKVLGF